MQAHRTMTRHDLLDRTRAFALTALKFYRRLPDVPEARDPGRQLLRAATAVRSNYRAARNGRSRAEFTARLGTVCEEASECVDRLEYLRDGRIAHDPVLLQEARELASIFGKAIQTARQKTKVESGK